MKRTLIQLTLLATLAGCPLGKSESTPTSAATTAKPVPTVAVTSAARTASAPAPSVVPVLDDKAAALLEPGKSFGPIRLGMSKKDLEGLGLAISPAYAGLQVGPYRVLMEADKVTFIEARLMDLPGGLKIGDKVVPTTERDIEAIAKLLSGCGKLDPRDGGNVIECTGVDVAAAGPPGLVLLQVSA